ncbi:hypothetical protein FV232_05140 [Methylobacterium sp. WL30]|uniref:hypothetical protein n=1 Tax=unclassified Methylobacterium TaxID=2615210 RepID=UPI0011C80E15|nr:MULTISPECIES: hypothetical protein [unclassified Methylobacterium]TXN40493.1 hypothetical protein FV225_05970 [Methylobacterium sp. WL93]TXN52298.1 hypothetical protein FV227_04405 [Methylobacterium sp. WL119]TXN69669.1 hypothetical protein FV232_05140 [Methylobacterium sp. WL30]
MRQMISALTFVCFGGVALAQSADSTVADKTKNDVQLNELRTAPTPKQVGDLDPVQLASAHRERAASVDEKTNGLWQSWTTSICEGCGNTPPYQDTVRNDFANRKGLAGLKTEVNPGTQQQAVSQKAQPESPKRGLYTDLSNENIDQIRRMPGR